MTEITKGTLQVLEEATTKPYRAAMKHILEYTHRETLGGSEDHRLPQADLDALLVAYSALCDKRLEEYNEKLS